MSFKESKDEDDERHVHPLQLDVIERILQLWSNPGEVVLTPFMGVGSEVFQAVRSGRRGLGIELKPSYYRQAVKNIEHAEDEAEPDQVEMFEKDIDFLGEMGIEPELTAPSTEAAGEAGPDKIKSMLD